MGSGDRDVSVRSTARAIGGPVPDVHRAALRPEARPCNIAGRNVIYLLTAQGRAPSRGGRTLSYPSGEQQSDEAEHYRHAQNPPTGTPSPDRQRKQPAWPWIAGGFVLILLICFGIVAFADTEDDEITGTEIAVTYEVRGTGSQAVVTYRDPERGMSRETDVALPWSADVPVPGSDSTVSMTAAYGADGGEITCRILVGGRVMTEQTSRGPYASASCSGDAGEQ